jgi:sRNA-binding carbon storage regulator CsrA
MNIKLAENQSFYLGEEIKVTVKAIYRQKDGQRYVQLDLQVPKNMLVFRDEKVAFNAQVAHENSKTSHGLPENIGNRAANPYSIFNLKDEVVNGNEVGND